MNSYIFTLLVYTCSLLIIWQFVGYPTLMSLFVLNFKRKNKDKSFEPSVSIIVPTYNECNEIKRRIINLYELDYPNEKYEIIIVDSGSKDGTDKIVSKIIDEHGDGPILKLKKEEKRNGKASAINLGKKFAKNEIILVTDANATFNKNVLKEMMPHFKDPKIGAVGGRYCVENPHNSITKSETFYWDLEYLMRLGESLVDSACLFHGEINAWRKDIIDADVKALSEDLDMCIKIRKKGYKIEYEPNAIVHEPSATNKSEQVKQRKRTSIGTIQNLFKHYKYLFLPKDLYSLLIYPSHKTLVVFSPFLIILISILYIVGFIFGLIGIVIVNFFVSCFLFLILFIILMKLKSKIMKESVYSSLTLKNLFHIFTYTLLNEYLLLSAWKAYLTKDYSVTWEKVMSNRRGI